MRLGYLYKTPQTLRGGSHFKSRLCVLSFFSRTTFLYRNFYHNLRDQTAFQMRNRVLLFKTEPSHDPLDPISPPLFSHFEYFWVYTAFAFSHSFSTRPMQSCNAGSCKKKFVIFSLKRSQIIHDDLPRNDRRFLKQYTWWAYTTQWERSQALFQHHKAP